MAYLRVILNTLFKAVSSGSNNTAVSESGKRFLSGGNASVSLDMMPHGVLARVLAVDGSGAVARRLMEMGLVPGAPVHVVKSAPLGDPIQVCIRDYNLALRRVEAQAITVITSIL